MTCRAFLISLVAVAGFATQVAAQLPDVLAKLQAPVNGNTFGAGLIPLGDQNDDGYDDFLVYSGEWQLLLFYGGDPLDDTEAHAFDLLTPLATNVGDLNGDGYLDFSSAIHLGKRLCVYYGGPDIDTEADLIFGSDSLYAIGKAILGDDLNEDGTDELIALSVDQNAVLFYDLGTSVDSVVDLILAPANKDKSPGLYLFGWNIIGADLNGDSNPDLAVNYSPVSEPDSSGAIYLYWSSVEFDSIPDMVIPRPAEWVQGAANFGELLVNIGDYNGDGFDDLLAGAASSFDDTTSFIFFGGPEIDIVPDLALDYPITVAAPAGDVNNDGYDDFITGYPLSWSALGEVNVFYGGPDADGLADIEIKNSDWPGYQVEFGMCVAGLGDVNGDGVDDFAFSALMELEEYGTVWILSDTGLAMGVDTDDGPLVPHDYELLQNHPNPFNPSTTIEFSLPERAVAELTVFNVLGQSVATILNEEMPAGNHSVTWDATLADGVSAPSGVYFYRLKAGDFTQSRKMILVK